MGMSPGNENNFHTVLSLFAVLATFDACMNNFLLVRKLFLGIPHRRLRWTWASAAHTFRERTRRINNKLKSCLNDDCVPVCTTDNEIC